MRLPARRVSWRSFGSSFDSRNLQMFRSPRFYLPVGGGLFGGVVMGISSYWPEAKWSHVYHQWGLGLSSASCALLIYLFLPELTSRYNARAVAQALKKCRPRARVQNRELFSSRHAAKQDMLKKLCGSFRSYQQFLLVYGSKGVGKTVLVKNIISFINLINDIIDSEKDADEMLDEILEEETLDEHDVEVLKGMSTVYVRCKGNDTPTSVLNALLDGFAPRLSDTARGTIDGVKSFPQLEKLLRENLPADRKVLIVIDGVKQSIEWGADLMEFTRDMSDTPPDGAKVKVMLVYSDAFDIEFSSFRKEGRAVPLFVSWPDTLQLEEFVRDVCAQNGVLLPSVGGDEEKGLAEVAKHLHAIDWNLPVLEQNVLTMSFKPTEDGSRILDIAEVEKNAKDLDNVAAKLAKVVDNAGVAVRVEMLAFLKQEIAKAGGEVEAMLYKEMSYTEFQDHVLGAGVHHDALKELIVQELIIRNRGNVVFHPQLLMLAKKYGRQPKKDEQQSRKR